MEKNKILIYTECAEVRGYPDDRFTKDSWTELESDLAKKIIKEIDEDSPDNSSWHFHSYSIIDALKMEGEIYIPLNSWIEKMAE